MKTTLLLFLLAVPITVARAQDSACATGQSADCAVPAVVYEAPVVYNAPVVYEGPVVYNAPVYYVASAGYETGDASYNQDTAALSTVTYIGGGRVGYQDSRCNSGSTVTVIGRTSRFR